MGLLIVDSWHTECGECGYGQGGWASSPALQGKTPLNPESRVCHGCGVEFTEVLDVYAAHTPRPIEEAAILNAGAPKGSAE